MSNSGQPFYHLRPNKYIDRQIFISTLEALTAVFPLRDYTYVGFGSYYFDDFTAVHKKLNINKLISLERDQKIFERAHFNKPFKCIRIEKQTSSEYINELDNASEEDHFIIWFDYCDSKDSALTVQFNEYSNLLLKLQAGDILRITLNANPKKLEEKKYISTEDNPLTPAEKIDLIHKERLRNLKTRIDEFLPAELNPSKLSYTDYPCVLLESLMNATHKNLVKTEVNKKYLFPLLTNTYADGDQMLTFTAVVLEDPSMENLIKNATSHIDFLTYDWEKICNIPVPDLTLKEYHFLNALLPEFDPEDIEQIKAEASFIKESEFKSFEKLYKYYPNFHHVNL